MSDRTIIIAEAGVNHNGSLELAKRLIDTAARAQADFVKFQTFKTENLTSTIAPKARYQRTNTGNDNTSQYTMLKQLELSAAMHEELIEYALQRDIRFLSTAFDIESIDLLEKLGIPIIKIPSGEITNYPYLRHVAGKGKPVIMSTGMADLDEVGAALRILREGVPVEDITVLHCSTEYPAPLIGVNLKVMDTIARIFHVKVGYSDHTEGIEVALAAAAMGASVIEKHFTLDKTMNGPDHKASLDPIELQKMVEGIRKIELAMGNGEKKPTSAEIENRIAVRKSIVASRAIANGEVFTTENLTSKRPGNGISPMRWDEFIGKLATRDYRQDELIEP
ncbi:MAG TPA: N-acetylneuraminate synthase [Bacteroidota bacterium]|nr:N-acetylneuraminate synthase [Bacteroidota bacterium]